MSKKKVGIIDYGAGNSGSIYNALNYLEYEPKFIQNPEEAKDYSHLILPGVGHFGKLANNLINNNWNTKLNHLVSRGHMLFGICVGMQLLFEKSAEAQGVKGLGILKGSLLNFQSLEKKFKLPIPHIGFNKVLHGNTPVWKGIKNNSPFYFIHSYRVIETADDVKTCKTAYQDEFISFVEKDNIFGSQFHPEKSHLTGLKLIKNFLELKN